MSMDAALTRLPECPACHMGVSDHEPGVSSKLIDGNLWHPWCASAAADEDADPELEEIADLLTHRLKKSLRRQTWMREASTLLFREGISANLTQWARAAFEDGRTPTEFLALVKDEKVAV